VKPKNFGILDAMPATTPRRPRVTSATVQAGMLVLHFGAPSIEGTQLLIPFSKSPTLSTLKASQVAQVKVSDDGQTLYFPEIEVGVLPLIEEALNMLTVISNMKRAGKVMSPERREALRINSQSGGRPLKPLEETPCNCSGGTDFRPEAHPTTCPRGRAIRYRIRNNLPLT
jgi:hypothetical protein